MELIRARRVTEQICILNKSAMQRTQSFYSVRIWVWKDDGSSEDEGLFVTQSSRKTDISGEIEGNVV